MTFPLEWYYYEKRNKGTISTLCCATLTYVQRSQSCKSVYCGTCPLCFGKYLFSRDGSWSCTWSWKIAAISRSKYSEKSEYFVQIEKLVLLNFFATISICLQFLILFLILDITPFTLSKKSYNWERSFLVLEKKKSRTYSNVKLLVLVTQGKSAVPFHWQDLSHHQLFIHLLLGNISVLNPLYLF